MKITNKMMDVINILVDKTEKTKLKWVKEASYDDSVSAQFSIKVSKYVILVSQTHNYICGGRYGFIIENKHTGDIIFEGFSDTIELNTLFQEARSSYYNIASIIESLLEEIEEEEGEGK